MKVLIGIVVCVTLSIVTSSCFPDFNPENDAVSTLYTVSGIMFSIGMSLSITFNTSGVKNLRIRKGIRNELRIVRNHFIWCFTVASLLYMSLYSGLKEFKEFIIHSPVVLKYSHLLVFTIAYAISFFVWNFLAIQRLNNQIEDALNEHDKT